MAGFFSARIILAKSLPQSLNLLEKNQIVAWREGILTKSKKNTLMSICTLKKLM